jgi:hypothetical protein
MSIAAASFTRFSRNACRASGEMLFPVISKGMNESFTENSSFFQDFLGFNACSRTTPPQASKFSPVAQRAKSRYANPIERRQPIEENIHPSFK